MEVDTLLEVVSHTTKGCLLAVMSSLSGEECTPDKVAMQRIETRTELESEKGKMTKREEDSEREGGEREGGREGGSE